MRIAYASRSSSAMPQYMAQGKGYFKAEGLEVELIQMNPRLGATAVVNGDVCFRHAVHQHVSRHAAGISR